MSIASIVVLLLGELMIKTQNFNYIFLPVMYGLDWVTTIFFRVVRNENISEGHRSHFYQYLADQLKWNHLIVAGFYAVVKLLCNVIHVFLVMDHKVLAVSFVGLMAIFLLAIRFWAGGKIRLLEKHRH